MSGIDVGEPWETAGGGSAGPGGGQPLSEAVWAHLRSVYSLWAPCVDRGVHSCRYVGLTCHLGPRIHVRTAVFVRSVSSLGLGLICFRMWAL